MSLARATMTESLRCKALELGFDLFGVAAIERVREIDYFEQWLASGYAGEMQYLERHRDLREDPAKLVEGARSVVVCAVNYHTRAPLSIEPHSTGEGWISRYAWGDDYHDVVKERIRRLYEYLVEISDGRARGRYYVDTGPVLEKVWAHYAGIGWIGKNTCLISQTLGSFLFLAVIVTDVELEAGTPPPDRCGSCTRCLDACPTQAFPEPYVLDARRCISYLTIEYRGVIPEALRRPMGRHVFGCDICQDVCPWNRRAPLSLEAAFQPRPGTVNPDLAVLLRIDIEAFRERFRRSPVKRTKYKGLIRNALVAAGNSGDPSLITEVERWLGCDDAELREHARWAYNQLVRTLEPRETADANY